jgi:hypothetical protein
MNISVGQKYRTKNREDVLSQFTFEVMSIKDDHNFGIIHTKQRGITLSYGPGQSSLWPESVIEKKFELVQ